MAQVEVEVNRAGSLVDVLSGVVYPLAHGDNIIGRENTKSKDTNTGKVPLRIPPTEINISRLQAVINVANHSDGTLISISTSRDAKNATRVLGKDRFGTARKKIALNPGEQLKLAHGDIIELDSVKKANSFAWRLEIVGPVSASPLTSDANESHFNAFGDGLGGEVSDDNTVDDENNSDEELIEQIRQAEDPALLELRVVTPWDDIDGGFVALIHEGMSVLYSGVAGAVDAVSPSSTPAMDNQARPPLTSASSFDLMTGMEEGMSEAWTSLWSLIHHEPSLLAVEQGEVVDEVELARQKFERSMAKRIQALWRGVRARRTVVAMWSAAAGELSRRLKKRLGRGETLLSEEGNGDGRPCVLWVIGDPAEMGSASLVVTGLKTRMKPLDMATLAFAHCSGQTVSLKFIGRKPRIEFSAATEIDASILGASLELISVWSGSSKPRYDQKRTSHFLALLKQCPKWLSKRKGFKYEPEGSINL